MTNQPIQGMLSKANTSGRVTKWSIELVEFSIEFTSRIINEQILVDFIVEYSFEKLVDPTGNVAYNLKYYAMNVL